jgi:hypothetical protein
MSSEPEIFQLRREQGDFPVADLKSETEVEQDFKDLQN